MKLYYSPGACSLAVHIALIEAGVPFEIERVDIRSKTTESGADFTTINPKGYVPALLLDSGERVTENIAVLDWVAAQRPSLGLEGALGRTRLLETLAYISTEVHKSFKPLFIGGSDEQKEAARRMVAQRLLFFAGRIRGPYLFGSQPTVADCYLFVMLLWANKFDIAVPDALLVLQRVMAGRPAVQKAMNREGLRPPLAEGSAQKRAGVA